MGNVIRAVFDHLQYALQSVLHTESNLKLNGGRSMRPWSSRSSKVMGTYTCS